MGQTTLSIRMDEDVKRRFDAFCAEVGMNASVAVNIFAKAVLREQRIPFEISAAEDPFYSEANQRHLRKAAAALDAGLGTRHELMEPTDALVHYE